MLSRVKFHRFAIDDIFILILSAGVAKRRYILLIKGMVVIWTIILKNNG